MKKSYAVYMRSRRLLFRFLACIISILALTTYGWAGRTPSGTVDPRIESIRSIARFSDYRVIDWYDGLSETLIVAVQDFHAHYPTQTRYMPFLESLMEHQNSFDIGYIGLEGTSGLIDTTVLQSYPDDSITRTVANEFLKKGIITGPECFSITAPQPVALYGIDDPQLYRSNAELFFRIHFDLKDQRTRAVEVLSYLKDVCDRQAATLPSQRESTFYERTARFYTSDISLLDYAGYMAQMLEDANISADEYPQFSSLMQVAGLRNAVDAAQLETEKQTAIANLKKILSADEYQNLMRANVRYSLGKISFESFYAIVAHFIDTYRLAVSTDSQLGKILSFVQILDSIHEPALQEELQSLMGQAMFRHGMSDRLKTICGLAGDIAVLNKMLNLTASRIDYDRYTNGFLSIEHIIAAVDSLHTGKGGLNFDPEVISQAEHILALADRFYADAVERDARMVDNALLFKTQLQAKTIVLVSGGFHTEGMARFLEEQSISYILLSPRVSGSDLVSSYESVMANTPDALDAYLSNPRSMLMPSSNFRNLLYPDNKTVMFAKWVIYASALSSLACLEDLEGDMDAMIDHFLQQETEWLNNLEDSLRQKAQYYGKGVITDETVSDLITHFRTVLDSIDFDFKRSRLFERSLLLPVTIHGDEDARVVLSVRMKNNETVDIASAFEEFEKIVFDEYEITVLPVEAMENIYQLNVISSQVNLTLAQQQNFFILLDLFGASVIGEMDEKYSTYDMDMILADVPARRALNKVIETIGFANARKLLLADAIGFFNLAYMVNLDETDDIGETSLKGIDSFVSSILHDTSRPSNKITGQGIPEFVIQHASLSDLSAWYRYGVPRVYDMDFWEERLQADEIFLRAVSPAGRVVGLIAARYVTEENAMFIDVLESCSQAPMNGIGTALLKEVVRLSMDAGYGGQIILDPREESKGFYIKLGFSTYEKYPEYFAISPEKAHELLGMDMPSQSSVIFDVEQQTDMLNEAKNMPVLTAIEWLANLMKSYSSLTPEDKIFIAAQLMRVNELTAEQAHDLLKDYLTSEGQYIDGVTGLYDALVDSWVVSENGDISTDGFDPGQPVSENALMGMSLKPVSEYIVGDHSTPDIDNFLYMVDQLQQITGYVAQSDTFSTPTLLRDDPFAIMPAKRMLRSHGMAVDVVIVPGEHHALAGSMAVLVDNTVYVNEMISKEDFWYILPHEIAHMLNDEYEARLHDADHIKHIKNVAMAFLDAAQSVDDTQKKQILYDTGARLFFTATRYEMDIIIARLQLTTEGKTFLLQNNIDRFTRRDWPQDYLEAIAASASQPLLAFPDKGMQRRLNKLLVDDRMDAQELRDRIDRQVYGHLVSYSISKAEDQIDKVDRVLSSWIDTQLNKEYWQVGETGVPAQVAPYVSASEIKRGFVDIVDIERSICTALRTMDDPTAKKELERAVGQWIAQLIRENIKPHKYVVEVSDVMKHSIANCLGYTKLYDAIARQFGLTVRNTMIQYELDGKIELHAVNLIRMADGTWEIIQVAQPPQGAVARNIIIDVRDGAQRQMSIVPMSEFAGIDDHTIDGLSPRTIEAATMVAYAAAADATGDLPRALNFMGLAYSLDPENPYIAYNMASAQFRIWRMVREETENVTWDDQLEELEHLFEHHQLYRLGAQAWDHFTTHSPAPENPYILVGMVDGINGAGGPGNPYYYRKPTPKPQEQPQPDQVQQPKQPVAPKQENVQKTDPDALARHMEMEGQLRRMQLEHQMGKTAKPNEAQRAKAVSQYKTTQMMGVGLGFSTARHLLQVGQQLDQMIQQQQYQEVMNRIMGLDPMFAARVMVQFPWIMALMLEMYPEWWLGPELRELARKANLSEEIQKEMKRRLTTVTGITETSDRDLFRRFQGENPLWHLLHKRNMYTLLNRVYDRGQIDAYQFKAMYDLLDNEYPESTKSLSPAQVQLLLGKRDELPLDPALHVKDGFLLGGMFKDKPVPDAEPIYCRYMQTVVDEHPHETAYALRTFEDADATVEMAEKYDVPVFAGIANRTGGLSVIADEVFTNVNDDHVSQYIELESRQGDFTFLLEAVLTTNLLRPQVRELIRKINNQGILDRDKTTTLSYFNNLYIEGDEKTPRFRKAFTLFSQIVDDQPMVKEDIKQLAAQLRHKNPASFLYAMMQTAERFTEPDTDVAPADQPQAIPVTRTLANRELLESAM